MVAGGEKKRKKKRKKRKKGPLTQRQRQLLIMQFPTESTRRRKFNHGLFLSQSRIVLFPCSRSHSSLSLHPGYYAGPMLMMPASTSFWMFEAIEGSFKCLGGDKREKEEESEGEKEGERGREIKRERNKRRARERKRERERER